MKAVLIASMAAASFGIALASANAQTSAPEPVRSAQDLFAAKCSQCHEKGGWGTRSLAKRMDPEIAELRKREPIPSDYVKYVVRRGIGSMPQFTVTDLSNEELDRLATWFAKQQ